MKKNVTILCMAAILAVFFTSCSGGGGGSLSNLFTSVEGPWIDETAENGVYNGFYLSDGKAYMAVTKDKETIYYTKEKLPLSNVDPGTYTSSGNEVKITFAGKTQTCTRDGDTMTYTYNGKKETIKKRGSAKLEAKTGAEIEKFMVTGSF